MTSLTHPVGPLAASTYWRRRAILLLAVGLVITLAAAAVWAGRATWASGAWPGALRGGGAALAPCAVDDLRVTARTDAGIYAAGERPRLTAVVANHGTARCTADLGPRGTSLVLSAGSERVWSASDCVEARKDAAADVRTLAPAGSVRLSVRWDRTRSAPECAGGLSAPPTGTYVFTATSGGRRGQHTVFALRGP